MLFVNLDFGCGWNWWKKRERGGGTSAGAYNHICSAPVTPPLQNIHVKIAPNKRQILRVKSVTHTLKYILSAHVFCTQIYNTLRHAHVRTTTCCPWFMCSTAHDQDRCSNFATHIYLSPLDALP